MNVQNGERERKRERERERERERTRERKRERERERVRENGQNGVRGGLPCVPQSNLSFVLPCVPQSNLHQRHLVRVGRGCRGGALLGPRAEELVGLRALKFSNIIIQ